MILRRMARFAALAVLTALAVSPALPVGSACVSACGRTSSRASHACCRPRAGAPPLAVRAPGCCRPDEGPSPVVVLTAIDPAAKSVKSFQAHPATGSTLVHAVRGPESLVWAIPQDTGPPAPSPRPTVLRI